MKERPVGGHLGHRGGEGGGIGSGVGGGGGGQEGGGGRGGGGRGGAGGGGGDGGVAGGEDLPDGVAVLVHGPGHGRRRLGNVLWNPLDSGLLNPKEPTLGQTQDVAEAALPGLGIGVVGLAADLREAGSEREEVERRAEEEVEGTLTTFSVPKKTVQWARQTSSPCSCSEEQKFMIWSMEGDTLRRTLEKGPAWSIHGPPCASPPIWPQAAPPIPPAFAALQSRARGGGWYRGRRGGGGGASRR